MLLMSRAIDGGWTVFEAGAASLMAGQQFFGQLEERLHRVTAELAVEKRVIWEVLVLDGDFDLLADGLDPVN